MFNFITSTLAPAPNWMSGAAAFAVAALFIPFIIHFSARWQLYDSPGPLKIHAHRVSRLGGVSIAAAVFAGLIVARPTLIAAWPFFAALALVWLAGLIDDIGGFSPVLRIGAQIAGAVLLWYGGWRLPLHGTIGLAAQCAFVVVFVNAFNFLDGADGLAAGVVAIIACGYAVLPGLAASPIGSAVAWSVAGSCAGFLLFNFPPARIFMGDSGSNALGFAVAFLGLCFYQAAEAGPSHSEIKYLAGSGGVGNAALIFPFFLAALPLLDAFLAVLRRLRHRSSPFYGDRRHFYDLLLARGWPQRAVAVACYAITVVLVAAGRFALRDGARHPIAPLALVLGALLAAAISLGSLRTKTRIGLERRGVPAPKTLPHRGSRLG